MNRIDKTFSELKEKNQAALVAFITAGDPWPEVQKTADLVVQLAEGGADVVELGIPYSDPQADGPTVQASSQRALESGVNTPFVFDVVRKVRERSEVPIVLMTYYNPVYRYGLGRFADDAVSAGADGLILTDLPPEEAGPWLVEAERTDCATIFLVAPTSTEDRIHKIASSMTRGFVYCVSRTGVTGVRRDVPVELSELLGRIRSATSLPVSVGFGINTPEQVARIAAIADGVVIGSALVDFLFRNANQTTMKEELTQMVNGWKMATQRSK